MDMRVIMKALGGLRGQMNRLESNVATMQANQGKLLLRAEVTLVFPRCLLFEPAICICFQRAQEHTQAEEDLPDDAGTLEIPWDSTTKAAAVFGDRNKEKVIDLL